MAVFDNERTETGWHLSTFFLFFFQFKDLMVHFVIFMIMMLKCLLLLSIWAHDFSFCYIQEVEYSGGGINLN